jgi:indolepyruvate ferredoxin oxidoreductase
MFMLGYAFQKGCVPLTADAIMSAIELNGVSIDLNRTAFAWGRRAAANLARVEELVRPHAVVPIARAGSPGLDEVIARRVDFLTAYQDAAYAARYGQLVARVKAAEAATGAGGTALAEAVARAYFKLLAYKDEYEVARLHSRPEFMRRIEGMFEGSNRLKFHLAPPLLNPPDPVTGIARKSEFGPWMLGAFRLLARLKHLRGTPFDLFGRSAERRMERQLIADYEKTVAELLSGLRRENLALAVELASIPLDIRGFGHVKQHAVDRARRKESELLARFRAGAEVRAAA